MLYLPTHFREDRLPVQHALLRAHPLGLLVTAGPSGLAANPLPFVLYADEGEHGTLRAHFARANPLAAELRAMTATAGSECLVVFQGPQAYVTPSWYASKRDGGKVVPTWNYALVQVRGTPRLIDGDPAWLRRQIEDLTHSQEDRRPAPWQVDDAPADFVAAQLRALVGLELPIARIEGKWKVSQNRPAADRQSVVDGLRAEPGTHHDAMAALVEAGGRPRD